MSSKLLNAEGSSEASFRLENMRRVPQKDNLKSFFIALLLLIVAFFAFVAVMLIHYPQKIDAFLNSDNPVQSRQVVSKGK